MNYASTNAAEKRESRLSEKYERERERVMEYGMHKLGLKLFGMVWQRVMITMMLARALE